MYIGTIVSDKVIDIPDFIKLVKKYEDVDIGKPILVVGTKKTKEVFGENIKYIDRVIDKEQSIFWTFSPFEKRTLMDKDVETFINYSIEKIKSKINYVYIDILNISKNKLKKILFFLLIENKEKFVYFKENNSFVYIYHGYNVIGINLDLLYLFEKKSLNKNKISDKIKNNKYNIICENDVFDEINKELLRRINNDYKLLPYFSCIQ